MTADIFVSELIPLRVKKILSHAHKAGSWYLLGVLFKISDEYPRHLHTRLSPPGCHVCCFNEFEMNKNQSKTPELTVIE